MPCTRGILKLHVVLAKELTFSKQVCNYPCSLLVLFLGRSSPSFDMDFHPMSFLFLNLSNFFLQFLVDASAHFFAKVNPSLLFSPPLFFPFGVYVCVYRSSTIIPGLCLRISHPFLPHLYCCFLPFFPYSFSKGCCDRGDPSYVSTPAINESMSFI